MHKRRDNVSVLAIGIFGTTSIILQAPILVFNPKNINQFNTENFKYLAVDSLKRNSAKSITDGTNTL